VPRERLPPPATKKEEVVTRDERRLRGELAWLRSRYDDGKVSPAVFAVVKAIETELSWCAHARKEARERCR